MKTRRTSPLAAVAPATPCSAGGSHQWAHYNLNRRCWQTCQKCGKTIDHTSAMKARLQKQTGPLVRVESHDLLAVFRSARRACRPQVGDRLQKRFLADSGITEVLVTRTGKDEVEWKRHFFHDSGDDWELDRPHASHLHIYRKMMVNSLRRGCEFIPANDINPATGSK